MYNHRKSKAIEFMVVDALVAAERELRIKETLLDVECVASAAHMSRCDRSLVRGSKGVRV